MKWTDEGWATWPFDPLAPLSYDVIVADPPWRFVTRSSAGEKKSPQQHYQCLSLPEIAALPVAQLGRGDCVLAMWATAPMLPDAIELMKAWGFRYVTCGAWAKRSKADRAWQFGTGYVLRSAMEPFLIGTIGNPSWSSRSERNLIVAPVREHSRKPDQFFGMLERLAVSTRRAELFAREPRPGWDVWGDEADKFADDGLNRAADGA